MSPDTKKSKATLINIDVTGALKFRAAAILAAAKAGESPIRVIAADIQHHLGSQQVNAMVGRMIREWLGPTFKVVGRKKWPREHGTESGAIYAQVG
ncbi:hypothetical protein [Sphingomonas sp. CFBP 8760]|jgi:hypothetical protein|uniref:hypothetical protein n=1 Tax=Sphingomonas sp. CFBP 8760 TaxID=2775282 RepID=UPI00177AE7A2|nr:hypothetical protein [Sphingomonas sp. CFBP 8760]MBD8547997.1 hypothetical protein [Sphingomonas sp. CFBP 8760]